MQMCSNTNLRNIINQKAECFERQNSEQMYHIEFYISCQIFREIMECVRYLHELNPPIIHRDLKPENFLILEKPRNKNFLQLCDFGLSRFTQEGSATMTGGRGTSLYMPFELFGMNGKSRYDHRVDIHSCGVIATQLFDIDINS